MAAVRLSGAPHDRDGVEAPTGTLGAVLRAAGSPGPVLLEPGGPLLATTLEQAKDVLNRSADFALPFDVSRQRIREDDTGVKHTPPLSREAVTRGLAVLDAELDRVSPAFAGSGVDSLEVLRSPVARSTTAAVVPEADERQRDRIADLTLAWIDALGPVISAERSPRRWAGPRRAETRARRDLVGALTALGVEQPRARATALAAGIQVPVAAGAWSLTQLACRPDVQAAVRSDAAAGSGVVWEVLRLFPPTWLLPRVTTRGVTVGDTRVPAYSVVLVSPLALGRLETLAPGPDEGCAPLAEFDPSRWRGTDHRPGAWLPFGAGAHACPGRSLGLGQLHAVVSWATGFDLQSPGPPRVDTSRGLTPDPSIIDVSSAPVA